MKTTQNNTAAHLGYIGNCESMSPSRWAQLVGERIAAYRKAVSDYKAFPTIARLETKTVSREILKGLAELADLHCPASWFATLADQVIKTS